MTDSELGLITFKKSPRARRMSIKILQHELQVSLPRGFTEKEGLQFINQVREKLKKKQSKIEQKAIFLSENSVLKTLTFEVHIRKAARENIFSSLKSGILTIEYPDFLKTEDAKTQQYFWNSINYFLRNEAKRLLPARTKELADKFGFSYTDVKIQSSKTRWGSCNRNKNINLSFYLLILPLHLIDYVILHELCHTLEMNHGERFWNLMDKVTGNKGKALRKEMKLHSIPK